MKLSDHVTLQSSSYCMRLPGQGITDIDLLPLKFSECSQLFLSYNSISRLENIIQFKALNRLMLEYNSITYIEDLDPLAELPNLTELRLEGNKVCRLPFWNYHAIYICKELRLLNGKEVNRDDAEFIRYERAILNSLYFSHIVSESIKTIREKKMTDPTEISDLIYSNISEIPRVPFMNKIRAEAPKTNVDIYCKHLMKTFKELQNTIQDQLRSYRSYQIKHKNMLDLLSRVDDFQSYANVAEQIGATCLHSVGIDESAVITQQLKGKQTKHQPTMHSIKECFNLSSNLKGNKPPPMAHGHALRIQDTTSPFFVYRPTPNYHPQLVLEKFRIFIYESPYTRFIPSGSDGEDNDSSDDDKGRGLSFEKQLAMEISDSASRYEEFSSGSFEQLPIFQNLSETPRQLSLSHFKIESKQKKKRRRRRGMSVTESEPEQYEQPKRRSISKDLASPTLYAERKFFKIWKMMHTQKQWNAQKKRRSSSSSQQQQSSSAVHQSGVDYVPVRRNSIHTTHPKIPTERVYRHTPSNKIDMKMIMGDTIGALLTGEMPQTYDSGTFQSSDPGISKNEI